MKCVSCRKETKFIINANRVLICKLCKRKAQPNNPHNSCRHKFQNADGLPTNICVKCDVEADPSLFTKMPKRVQVPQELVDTFKNMQNLNPDNLPKMQDLPTPKINLPDSLNFESASIVE